MADKDQDIRNKVVDCSNCPNVQIYENETVIFFQVEGQELRVVQKGTITIQYKEGAVLFYENNIFLFEACGVQNIRKANNDIYAETYLELVAALSAFLGFSSGGGGGIANVANGLYDDGGTAKLGGELVEDTTVLGSNIYSLIFAFLDNFIVQGAVLQMLATSTVDISSDDAINIIANGLLQLTSANQINIDSSGAIRLTSNANEVSVNGDSLFYFGDSTSDGSFRIGVVAGSFIVEKRIAGVWIAQSFPVSANNGVNYAGGAVKLGGALLADTTISGLFNLILSGLAAFKINTNVVEQQNTGKYVFGETAVDGSYRIGLDGGKFAIQKRVAGVWLTLEDFDYNAIQTKRISADAYEVNLPIQVDFTTGTNTIYSIAMASGFQVAYTLRCNAKKTANAGGGYFQVIGSGERAASGASATTNANPSVISQESITGNFTITHAIVANNLLVQVAQSQTTKTRFQGTLNILITSIPDTF